MERAPRWFMIASVLALLWNLAGLLAFVSDATMGPEDVAKLSAAQQSMYAARPTWALAATGIATIGGTLGSLALVLAKRWGLPVLWASLLGLAGQDAALLSLPGGFNATGAVPLMLQAFVLLVAVALVLIARKGIAKGWLA
jgi:hypothetical protein